jgi:predicted transcriptional regulator
MSEEKPPGDYGNYENPTTMRFDILQMVSCGQRGQKEILWVMNARLVGTDTVLAMLAEMVRDGFLTQLRGGQYSVTSAGRTLMPSAQPQFSRGQYKPPPPMIRREGSDRAHSLPSMAAGVLTNKRGHD